MCNQTQNVGSLHDMASLSSALCAFVRTHTTDDDAAVETLQQTLFYNDYPIEQSDKTLESVVSRLSADQIISVMRNLKFASQYIVRDANDKVDYDNFATLWSVVTSEDAGEKPCQV